LCPRRRGLRRWGPRGRAKIYNPCELRPRDPRISGWVVAHTLQ